MAHGVYATPVVAVAATASINFTGRKFSRGTNICNIFGGGGRGDRQSRNVQCVHTKKSKPTTFSIASPNAVIFGTAI